MRTTIWTLIRLHCSFENSPWTSIADTFKSWNGNSPEILEAGLTEIQARTLWLDDADANYEPSQDGKSYLDWLNEILEIVRVALRERPADDDD